MTNFNLANGVNESYGYSADRRQLTSQTAVKGSTLMSLTYGYSATAGQMGASTTAGNTGQLVSISGTINGQSRSQAFTYDNVGRLLTASGWSGWGRRYSYDRWGNRTGSWNAVSGGTQLQNIAIATTGSVANNRIANVNGVNYSYDASGNNTNDGGHTNSYDAEGRLVSVDGGASTYAYDSSNWRVKKVSGGVTTHCVWEGARVIAEYNGSTGALISEYVFAGSRMVARDQGGVLRYFHQDRLSTRMITDGSGNVVGTQDHLPFGEDPATGSGENEKHRFTSYERDSESATDYAVNRQHQFVNARFMQADPIAGSIVIPQSLNRYSYVMNDPVNLKDPVGLLPCWGAECDWAGASGGFWGSDYSGGRGWSTDPRPGQGVIRQRDRLLTEQTMGQHFWRFIPGSDRDPTQYGTFWFDHVAFERTLVGIESPHQKTWEETVIEMEKIAKVVGGKISVGSDNVTYITGVTKTFNGVVTAFKNAGLVQFWNLNPEHFGGTDLKTSKAPWYHITVGYPDFPDGNPAYFDLSPPKWITIHGHANDPSSFKHFREFVQEKAWWIQSIPWGLLR
jgi:RHS repeat-associated protein